MTSSFQENHTCRICGNGTHNKVYTAKEMMYGLREEFDYFECGSCGCLQIVDIPEEMAKYYPGDYYSLGKYNGKKFRGFKGGIKKFQYRNSALRKGLFKSLFGIKEYRIFNDLGISKDSKILDVGCGNGRNFLYPLAEVGFTHVLGCDPYLSEAIHYDNGLVIEKADVFDITGSWDVITYHHAFEHLPNPKENLEKIHDLLSEKGVCILRIPTVSSFAWEHYKEYWVQLDAPRHFFLHSKASIELLAEQTGMELMKVLYDSNHFQFMGSEKYLKDIPLSTKKEKGLVASLRRKVAKSKYGRKAKALNKQGRGDQAAFFLRKK
ncbi:MAG: class I SAM-dependent methyltransferase [Bacteroidota bacterium]